MARKRARIGFWAVVAAIGLSLATASGGALAAEETKPAEKGDSGKDAVKAAKTYKCKCGQAFETAKEKVGHAIKDHKKKGCAECGVFFKSARVEARHMIKGHQKKGCAKCAKVFEADKDAVEHAVKKHKKRGCVACAKLFKDKAEAKEHKGAHKM